MKCFEKTTWIDCLFEKSLCYENVQLLALGFFTYHILDIIDMIGRQISSHSFANSSFPKEKGRRTNVSSFQSDIHITENHYRDRDKDISVVRDLPESDLVLVSGKHTYIAAIRDR